MGWLAKGIEEACARKNFSPRTRECYTSWTRTFWRYLNEKDPREWDADDVRQFLTFMCTGPEPYSIVAQKQAKNAIVFVFREVLAREIGDFSDYLRTPEFRRPPVVLSRDEVSRLFEAINPRFRFRAELMYRCGLRVGELVKMRVADLDVPNLSVAVHDGKGGVHRRVPLPERLVDVANRHIAWRARLHDLDLADGSGLVDLPARYKRKFPSACRELGWQWLFPSQVVRDGFRWYCGDTHITAAIRNGAKKAGIIKRVTSHTLRHSYATHLLQAGCNIRDVQAALGHKSVETTMIYTHVEAGGIRTFAEKLAG